MLLTARNFLIAFYLHTFLSFLYRDRFRVQCDTVRFVTWRYTLALILAFSSGFLSCSSQNNSIPWLFENFHVQINHLLGVVEVKWLVLALVNVPLYFLIWFLYPFPASQPKLPTHQLNFCDMPNLTLFDAYIGV